MDLDSLFDMGRHATHVWAAIAISVAVLSGLFAVSLRGLRARQAQWERLRAEQGEPDETEA